MTREDEEVDDSKFRKVSISTNFFLFNEEFKVNENVYHLLSKLKNRYKIFLITQVDSDGGEAHKVA